MVNKIIVIAPLSSLSRRTRLYKLAIFLNDTLRVKDIVHVGWERVKGEKNEHELNFPIKKKIILKGGGYGGLKVRFMYFIWMLKVFFQSFKIKKNELVWALGFESAFPALLVSKIKGFKVIFDDADRFSLIFNFPFPIKIIIQSLEKFTSRKVVRHVVPGIERYDFFSSKFYVLKNTPSKSEYDKGLAIFKEKSWPKAKLIININGWLHKTRGLDVALKLYGKIKNYDVHFLMAGKLASKEAIELSTKKKVTYIGEVSNSEALASYFASDFVLTYFKPVSKINTLSESNKWGDAIRTNTAVIVNEEVITAEYLRENKACLSNNYDDISSLASNLIEIMNDKKLKEGFMKNSSKLSQKFSFFEVQLTKLFETI